MKTLNGLPRSWDSFFQGICARKKLIKFSRLWEEFSQEEARIAAREEKMGSEDQDLTVHSKKGRRENHHHQVKHSHQKNNIVRRDPSKLRCYTCDEIWHFARNCPMNKNGSKKMKNSKRRHHDHTAEDDDPPRKKLKQESDDSSSGSSKSFLYLCSFLQTIWLGHQT